jgi:uncharacterized protein YndB with AHSA1/START domain
MTDTRSTVGARTYELCVEREYTGSAQSVFTAYLDMHGEDRPDWIVDSQLDLRVGGTWAVTFHPPDLEAFSEHRVFSVVDPPHHLAYDMRASFDNQPTVNTTVDIVVHAESAGSRLVLVQRGFQDEDVRDQFAGGWRGVLEAVQPYIAER